MWTSAVDIEITSSSSVNSRIRVAFLNRRQGSDFRFLFSLATPTDAKILMRRAFLSQSFAFMEKAGIDFNSSHYCYLLDHVQFDIKGRFESLPSSSAASSVPIYLFIDPLKTQMINGLPCLEYPPKAPFVHWSLNPDGPGAPVDIHEYGLPQVQLEIWIGTWWGVAQYEAVKEYLRLKGYDPYNIAFAVDHGYPLLTYGKTAEGIEPRMETSITDVTPDINVNFDITGERDRVKNQVVC